MAVTSVSVILTVFVLKLHHCGSVQAQVPPWVRWFVLGTLARAVGCPSGQRSTSTAAAAARQRDRIQQKTATTTEKLATMDDIPLRPVLDRNSIRRHFDIPDNRRSLRQRCDVLPEMTSTTTTPNDVTTPSGDDGSSLFIDRGAASAAAASFERHRLGVMEEILGHLKLVVNRRDEDEREAEVVTEWRQVAGVVDRVLFWCFLATSTIGTVLMLIVIPLYRK